MSIKNWHFNPFTPHTPATVRPVETFGPNIMDREGIALWLGESGVGKTTLLMALLHQWTIEEPYLHQGYRELISSTPLVWYLALEDQRSAVLTDMGFAGTYCEHVEDVSARGFRRLPNGCLSTHGFKLITPPDDALDLTDSASVKSVFTGLKIEGLKDADEADKDYFDSPDIVVIDNLSYCRGVTDENDTRTAEAVHRGLRLVKELTKAKLVILVHHPAPGTKTPRGSKVLFNRFDCAVFISSKADTLKVENLKARGFAKGAVRLFRRKEMQGRVCGTYLDFDDVTDTAVAPSKTTEKPAKAAPASKASPEPAGAAQASVGPAAPALTPPTPKHPAEGLRGLPLEVWQLLALDTGESITAEAAKVKALTLPTFEAIEPRRRNDRWCEVLESFTKKGLHDPETGLITNR